MAFNTRRSLAWSEAGEENLDATDEVNTSSPEAGEGWQAHEVVV